MKKITDKKTEDSIFQERNDFFFLPEFLKVIFFIALEIKEALN